MQALEMRSSQPAWKPETQKPLATAFSACRHFAFRRERMSKGLSFNTPARM